MTITELCHKSDDLARRKGWYDEPRSFGDLIALMHSELSEALEEYRAGHSFTEVYYNADNPSSSPIPLKPEGIPIELADCVIRIAQFCGQHNIDLEAALTLKTAYNETRAHRHGGKKI